MGPGLLMELCRQILSTYLDQMKSDKKKTKQCDGAGEVAQWLERLACKPSGFPRTHVKSRAWLHLPVTPVLAQGGYTEEIGWWCELGGQPGRDDGLPLVLRMRRGQSWQQQHCPTPHVRTISGLK